MEVCQTTGNWKRHQLLSLAMTASRQSEQGGMAASTEGGRWWQHFGKDNGDDSDRITSNDTVIGSENSR